MRSLSGHIVSGAARRSGQSRSDLSAPCPSRFAPSAESRIAMTPTIKALETGVDTLGESPVWDIENQCLCWVDGVSRLIRSLDPATQELRRWQTPSMVGSIGLASGRSFVCGLADGIYLFDPDSGQFEPLLQPDPPEPTVRFNDGKVDRHGRFLCGSMGRHGERLGRLWRVDRSGRADMLVEGIQISNSLCFSPDGATMYFADSLEGTIRAYPYATASAR